MNNEGVGCGEFAGDELAGEADTTKDEDFLNGNTASNAALKTALTDLGDGYMKDVVVR